MESVWLVEKGEYSDYGVHAIFATQQKADEFSAHLPESSVREWPLDTWVEEQSKFVVTFNLRGDIVRIDESAYTDELPAKEQTDGNRHKPSEITVYVNRGPRERAIKIASEYYTRIRTFLDEATERTEKYCSHEHDFLRTTASLMVAEVLAGLKPPPKPPLTGFEKMVLNALGLPK